MSTQKRFAELLVEHPGLHHHNTGIVECALQKSNQSSFREATEFLESLDADSSAENNYENIQKRIADFLD